MKPALNTKFTSIKPEAPPLTVVVIGVLVLIALVWGGMAIFSQFNTKSTANYAEEAAKPLEDALAKAGAVKKCSQGDAGRGSDSNTPNYDSRYQLDVGKDEAAKLINKIAQENGFTLSHTDSPYESIEWYTDKTTKESSYPGLAAGKVMLNISTYNDTAKQVLTCSDGTSLLGNDTHTAVMLTVGLPPMQR